MMLPLGPEHEDFLRDESRQQGCAEHIAFPATEAELVVALQEATASKLAVTLQGGRTGISAGAVPNGGAIINVSRMTRCGDVRREPDGTGRITVEPGVLLVDLRDALPPDLWFAPDLTEMSASLGGLAACNGSGARSFHYGPARRHIAAARVVLVDGEVLSLRRGAPCATGRTFAVRTESGRELAGELCRYEMPHVKNAAGYYAADDMDLLDLFIGSDGTLGVFAELELILVPRPKVVWGLMAFLPSEAAALDYVAKVRAHGRANESSDAAVVGAIEYVDRCALDLLRRQKIANPAFAFLPDLPLTWNTGVYVECQGSDEDAVQVLTSEAAALMVACGGDDEATWLADDAPGIERFKAFRHAVPEAVNLVIDERRKNEPALTKLGTDLAVPDEHLPAVMAMYRDDLERRGFDYVIFGHIGDNHVHVNILPRDLEAYREGKACYLAWAEAVVAMGGSVAAEHGVGKLKREMFALMYGPERIADMQRVKAIFDPETRLNPMNLFGVEGGG